MQFRSIIVACGILIGGLLILAGICSFYSMGGDSNPPGVSATISDCKQLSVAFWAYKADYGAYPQGTASDIIKVLSGDNPEKNIYLDKGSLRIDDSGFPIDAWSHRIEILVTSDGNITVTSPGKDGVFKKGSRSDDIEITNSQQSAP